MTLLAVCLPVSAAITPKAQPFDTRVTLTKYKPEDVIRVRTKIGISTLIQLQKGEYLSSLDAGIGIGDAEAWGLDVKGNNIFLKPIAAKPDTNLLLTTNKGRTYSFQLVSSKYPHYVVKLAYDKPKTSEDNKRDIPCSDGNLDFRYGKMGDEAIAPQYMWDDGRFTCMKFTDNAELPVVYQVSNDGVESLVNYHIEKDTVIVHSVSNEFRVRLDKQVVGLYSDHAMSNGYNEKATAVNAKRELTHE
jgi:type IV secretion system protein VirB9